MTHYLTDGAFWLNLLWLATAAALLAAVVGVLLVGWGSECNSAIVLLLAFSATAVLLCFASGAIVRYACNGSWGFTPFSPEEQINPAAVFLTKRPLLYEHYQQLNTHLRASQDYQRALVHKHNEITYAEAKKELAAELARNYAIIQQLQSAIRDINDLGTRLYFADLMHTLGATIEADELEVTIDLIQRKSALTIQATREEQP